MGKSDLEKLGLSEDLLPEEIWEKEEDQTVFDEGTYKEKSQKNFENNWAALEQEIDPQLEAFVSVEYVD